MRLSEICQHLSPAYCTADTEFHGLSIDSRSTPAGALFLALRGDRVDGHDFAGAAVDRGAAALVVSRQLPFSVPQLITADPLLAATKIGALYRARFSGRVIAITGSCGKTSVKGMVGAILARSGRVLTTAGNQNNHLGVPLTLARLVDQDYAVLELGTNHPGEIGSLAMLAQPHVALVTNVAPAHIGNFTGLDAIATEKAAIYESLNDDGIAIINANSPYAQIFRQRARGRQLEFGNRAQIRATDITFDNDGAGRFRLHLPTDSGLCALQVPGAHMVENALAASACAFAVGISLPAIIEGLSCYSGESGRMERLSHPSGAEIINDAYNANPSSMEAAILWLGARPGRRVLVMGPMAELGEHSASAHTEAGAAARAAGIDALYCFGAATAPAARAFGMQAQWFVDRTALTAALGPQLQAGTTVLFKGSRSAQLEVVLEALMPPGRGTC